LAAHKYCACVRTGACPPPLWNDFFSMVTMGGSSNDQRTQESHEIQKNGTDQRPDSIPGSRLDQVDGKDNHGDEKGIVAKVIIKNKNIERKVKP